MTSIGLGTTRRLSSRPLSLTTAASLTALTSWLDYVARVLVGFVVTPILLTQLGAVLFGVWEMLLRIASYATVADGRPMEALRLVVARGEGSGQVVEQRQAVTMAVLTWALFLPITVTAGVAIVWFAPMAAGVDETLVQPVRVAAGLLVLNLVLVMLVALPEAVLSGVNQGYRRMGLLAATQLFGGLLMVMAVRAGLGLPGLAAAQAVTTLCTAGLYLRLVRAVVPWFGVARPDVGQLPAFMRLSGWSMAGDAVAKIALASDVVILGALASATAVTSYVLTAYASQAAVGVATLGVGAVVPGLARVAGAGADERSARLHGELIAFGWLVGTVIGAVIVLWNRSFLAMWVGPEHAAGRIVNALLALMLLQTVLIRCEAAVLNALLQLRTRVLIGAVAAVLACGLAVALVPMLGVVGLCLGLCAGRLVQSVGLPMAVNTALGRASWSGAAWYVRPAAASALVLAASVLIEPRLHAPSWLALSVGVATSGAVLLPMVAVTGLTPDQRGDIWNRLAGAARFRSPA